ncbi:unnamed protein product [Pleuronectes platessa]|uniref:Uncharacterized protein n=1 Tax=Pleuronectes platessa TaxID=8262 RepID=A0A9N7TPC9_PLEPL|nr:unnamed protein product [Pleuronectes platessa]
MVPRVTGRLPAHNNKTLLLSSCSTVPLFIWHCAGGLPVRGWFLEGGGGEDAELEKVGVAGEEEEALREEEEEEEEEGAGGCFCIQQPTPGLWLMKEAPQKTAAARHSDKTLQIVPLIKNLSCRNTIDSKRGRENRQPELSLSPPPASYTL